MKRFQPITIYYIINVLQGPFPLRCRFRAILPQPNAVMREESAFALHVPVAARLRSGIGVPPGCGSLPAIFF